MYCNYVFNSGCQNCNKYVKSIDVKGTDTELVIAIPAQSLCNCTTLCICVAQPIPDVIGENSELKILVGNDEYPVINMNANYVYGDQIRSGRVYCFKFATDTLGFIYRGGERLCKTKHAFTCVPLPPAPVKANKKPKPKVVEE